MTLNQGSVNRHLVALYRWLNGVLLFVLLLSMDNDASVHSSQSKNTSRLLNGIWCRASWFSHTSYSYDTYNLLQLLYRMQCNEYVSLHILSPFIESACIARDLLKKKLLRMRIVWISHSLLIIFFSALLCHFLSSVIVNEAWKQCANT